MPVPTAGALMAAGAFLSVDVDLPPQVSSTVTAAGQAPPPSATGLALVDTGATLTAVHEPLLKGLGLNPVGVVTSGTAAGPIQQSLYFARLVFPVLGWTIDQQVTGVDLTGQAVQTNPPQPIVALLGRNLLQNAVLIWNGPAGSWALAT